MDHLLDHSTAETEWITYNKKSADDLTHKSEKRTERGVFHDSNYSELVKLSYDFILRPLCDSKNRILSLLKSPNMFFGISRYHLSKTCESIHSLQPIFQLGKTINAHPMPGIGRFQIESLILKSPTLF